MPNKMFDREEMLKLSREGMEQSMRFFMTLNETILKIGDQQRELVNETTKKNIELLNKAYEEYQKNSRVVLGRMESMWQHAVDQATKVKENG